MQEEFQAGKIASWKAMCPGKLRTFKKRKMPYGMEAKECRGHSRQKTSEKNVRSKPEGKWSYLQYAGKIREPLEQGGDSIDRKSTRLNSSHHSISYAVFCLKKKKKRKLVRSRLIKKKKDVGKYNCNGVD